MSITNPWQQTRCAAGKLKYKLSNIKLLTKCNVAALESPTCGATYTRCRQYSAECQLKARPPPYLALACQPIPLSGLARVYEKAAVAPLRHGGTFCLLSRAVKQQNPFSAAQSSGASVASCARPLRASDGNASRRLKLWPRGVERSLLIDSFEAVGAKKVALRLDEVRGALCTPDLVKMAECCGQRRYRETCHRTLSDQFAQIQMRFFDMPGEGLGQEQVFGARRRVERLCYLAQKL